MRSPTLTRELVAFLRRPDAYPEGTAAVQAVETHVSWVFLTDSRAYKLKKPVRLDVVDLTRLEARLRNCMEELRLNRRLAPDVYLGLTSLVRTGAGFALGGPGELLDWLVIMRRLPAERMLDRALADGTAREQDLVRLGGVLARFYAAAPPALSEPAVYLAGLADSLERDRAALRSARYGLDPARVEGVAGAARAALAERASLLGARALAGRVVEGHGDLRPEHVCLEPTPVVIDCLEFDRALRQVDPADELAFLALECERLGDAAVGKRVLAAYAEACGDLPPRAVVDLHQVLRALRRAKLAAWHLDDEEVADPERWRRRANEYLALAEARLGGGDRQQPRAAA